MKEVSTHKQSIWSILWSVGKGTTEDTACAGNDPRLTPEAVTPNTALGRDASGGWVQRTAEATRTWLALQITNISGLVDALAAKANTSDVTAALATKAALAGSAAQAFAVATAPAGTKTPQAASTEFALGAVPVVPWYFELSATGTGAGVATLQLTCTAPTTLTISGAGKFYTDAAGTTGEATTWNLVVGLNVIYVKTVSGKATCKVAQGLFVSAVSGWTSGANAPSFRCRMSAFPRSINSINMSGSNTISGGAADFPPGLYSLVLGGSGALGGGAADFPLGTVFMSVWAPVTFNGNLADLASNASFVSFGGANAFTYNTTAGLCRWLNGLTNLGITQPVVYLTAAMGDTLLADLDASFSATPLTRVVTIPRRTVASDAIVSSLTAKGCTVTATVV